MFMLFASTAPRATFAAVEDSSLRVAHGVTMTSYAIEAYKNYEASTGKKVVVLNAEGMGADSVLIAVDHGRADLGISGNPWSSTLVVAKRKQLGLTKLDQI